MRGTTGGPALLGLLAATGVSAFGTRMSFLAIPWLVLAATGSATQTGLVAFAEMAPYVAVQALAGPLVDRWSLRAVSVTADVAAALAMGSVPALAAAHALSLPVLSAVVAAAGAARGAGDSARTVLLPGAGALAGASLGRASGLYDGVGRLASLLGAPLAGALVYATSAASVVAVDAATFAASAALVLTMVPPGAEPAGADGPAAGGTYVAALGAGLRHLARDRLLVAIAAMVLVTNFVDQAGGAVLTPVWAERVAHSSVALGLVGGALSLGAVAGNALTTWLAGRLPRRLVFTAGYLLAGAPRYLALALAPTVAPVLPVVALSGFGAGAINPVVGAVSYERVPRHLQARVLGAVQAAAWAGIPFAGLAAGFAVTAVGLRVTLLAAAAVYGLVTLAPLATPVWRDLDRSPRVGAEGGAEHGRAVQRPAEPGRPGVPG